MALTDTDAEAATSGAATGTEEVTRGKARTDTERGTNFINTVEHHRHLDRRRA